MLSHISLLKPAGEFNLITPTLSTLVQLADNTTISSKQIFKRQSLETKTRLLKTQSHKKRGVCGL